MKYFFYACICMILVLIQTTFVRYIQTLSGCYDLFIVIVVFLGLYRNFRESIPVILTAGLLMDTLYNGPFGLYMTSYLWLYMGIRLSSLFFNVRSGIFLTFVIAAGVLFENFVFITSFVMFNPDSILPENISGKILTQFIWAVLSGYLFIILIKKAYNVLSGQFNVNAVEQNGYGS